jgi:hypothetical protein
MRANKQPARTIDEVNVVGTAGRYYITFNPFSNAYQVSRKLPSYVRKEDFEPEMFVLRRNQLKYIILGDQTIYCLQFLRPQALQLRLL